LEEKSSDKDTILDIKSSILGQKGISYVLPERNNKNITKDFTKCHILLLDSKRIPN